MSKMLLTEDLVSLIEENTRSPVYNLCGVGEGVKIEGTDFNELIIWVYEKQNVNSLRVLTADIINVISVEFTGYPQAQTPTSHQI